METTIKVGNFYDSRVGNHFYAVWYNIYHCCIDENGKEYHYKFIQYDHPKVVRVNSYDAEEIIGGKTISWFELDPLIREAHFWRLNSCETEENMYSFVYGKEGPEKYRIYKWAQDHLVVNIETTLKLRERLGEFWKVRLLESKKSRKEMIFAINEQWQVIVTEKEYRDGTIYYTYSIKDFIDVFKEEDDFSCRCNRLSEESGIPINIVIYVMNIESDFEALEILSKIKAAKEAHKRFSTEDLIEKNTKIRMILGDELLKTLSNTGTQRILDLYEYIFV